MGIFGMNVVQAEDKLQRERQSARARECGIDPRRDVVESGPRSTSVVRWARLYSCRRGRI